MPTAPGSHPLPLIRQQSMSPGYHAKNLNLVPFVAVPVFGSYRYVHGWKVVGQCRSNCRYVHGWKVVGQCRSNCRYVHGWKVVGQCRSNCRGANTCPYVLYICVVLLPSIRFQPENDSIDKKLIYNSRIIGLLFSSRLLIPESGI